VQDYDLIICTGHRNKILNQFIFLFLVLRVSQSTSVFKAAGIRRQTNRQYPSRVFEEQGNEG